MSLFLLSYILRIFPFRFSCHIHPEQLHKMVCGAVCHKMPCKTAITAHICGIWFFHYRPLPQDALQNCNFSSYLWHLVFPLQTFATRCPVKLQFQLISVASGFSITDLCHKMPCKTAISAHICGIWFGRTCRAALLGLLYLREPDAGEAFSAGALAMTSEMTVESG